MRDKNASMVAINTMEMFSALSSSLVAVRFMPATCTLAALPPASGGRPIVVLTSARFLFAPPWQRYTFHSKVEPRMKPFYNWFAAVVVFVIAAVSPLPFALPVPWTGILLAVLVLSVCALPYLYGCVYIRLAVLAVSREPSFDEFGSEADARGVSDVGQGVACELTMGEDNLFGREIHPLLGSAGDAELSRCSLTWKQCLQVG